MLQKNYNHNKKAYEFIDSTTREINDICLPLFQAFNLCQFSYMRIYENGKIFRLVAHEKWSKGFFDGEFYNDPDFVQKDLFCLPVGGFKCKTLIGEPHGSHWQSLHSCNIWNVFIYYKRKKDFVECCCFGATPENDQIINLYLNNFDLLHNFILYFKDHAADLINKADTDKLIISEVNFFTKDQGLNKKEDIFLEEIKKNRYSVSANNNDLVLSSRQFEVLNYLLRGRTTKEIGKFLNVSPRTIESYIQDLRTKTNTYSKSKLLEFLLTKKWIENEDKTVALLALLREKNESEFRS